MTNYKSALRRLKDEANIEDVINHLGIPAKKSGANTFITCPNPAHNDEHPTNCYFKAGWDHVYCTVCGTTYNALNTIIFSRHCELKEAIKELYEIEGRPSFFTLNLSKEKERKQNSFFLTNEEAKFLGMKMPHSLRSPVDSSEIKQYSSNNMPKGYLINIDEKSGEYLLEKVTYVTKDELLDEKALKYIVRNFCEQKKLELDRKSEINKRLFLNLDLNAEYKKLNNIRKRTFL